MMYSYSVVDVFAARAYRGNPVAVVLDADDLSTEQMQTFANWTNLSETTFVLAPSSPRANYRVRIFTPDMELPFAGHPTLGTCHAWRSARRAASITDVVVQECAAGLIELRCSTEGIAFAAPPLLREGPVEEELVAHIAEVLRIEREEIKDSQWVDNGPGWIAVLLESAAAVLQLRPANIDLDIGVVGAYSAGAAADFEVRAFFARGGATFEDPVTGSLNAGLASWLLGTARATSPYVVSQGTTLGREGKVYVERDARGTIWIGGNTFTGVTGEVKL